VTHDFAERLAYSHAQADALWWHSVYEQAFPTLASMTNVRGDGWAQRGGIDRVLVLGSGRSLHIDEKVRERDYDDILLEFWSDRDRKVPGWVAKDLACDYIAYAFVPSQRCYLLPFHDLRRAWGKHRHEWVARFGTREAVNQTYVTVGCPVSIPTLLDAIRTGLVIHWEDPTE
jgi:hypothetical protein